MLEAYMSGVFRRDIYQAAYQSLNDLYTGLPLDTQSYVQ